MLRLAFVAAAAAALALPAAAAPGSTPGRRGPEGRVYDPATETTVSGRVEAVRTVEHRRGAGLHVELSTGGGPLVVHLGPKAFVEGAGVSLAPGDSVEVTGSRVGEGEGAFLVARSVTEGGVAVALRDELGRPLWAGGRRGR